jgi:hypothetical protein
MLIDPLPLRTCSRCNMWYGSAGAADETGKQKAPCLKLGTVKYGSDSCQQWVKKE